jgi:hypothetical protein
LVMLWVADLLAIGQWLLLTLLPQEKDSGKFGVAVWPLRTAQDAVAEKPQATPRLSEYWFALVSSGTKNPRDANELIAR